MKKTRLETIEELNKELETIEILYKAKCLKWSGTTTDTDEHYSEIIANELLRNLKEFDKIPTVTRNNSYYTESHCNIEIDICGSNRNEELFAKRITGVELDDLGLVLDYQVPLKDTASDEGLGKIDLISFDEDIDTLYLIELKYAGSKDTLLKATLQSYIYYQTVDKMKLVNDYLQNHKLLSNNGKKHISPEAIKVKPAVLLVPECDANNELNEVEIGERPKTKALVLALDMKIFTFEYFTNGRIL
jgi:hypothetical protein